MASDDSWTATRCKRLVELPQVVGEWQQKVCCPACDYYRDGECHNPNRTVAEGSCPFDGKPLPLREVSEDTTDEQPSPPFEFGPCALDVDKPNFDALEQAIKIRIMEDTGRRIQSLAIELINGELNVRGTTTCYYVKQLALYAAITVLQSVSDVVHDLKIDVSVVPTTTRAPVADDSHVKSIRAFVNNGMNSSRTAEAISTT